MTRQSLITKMKVLLSKVPLAGWIGGGVLAIAIGYSVIFFIPKPVTFSYAEQTCVGHLALAPQLQKASSDSFDIEFQDTFRVAGVEILSTKLCITPKKSPEEGMQTASIAPFGSVIGRKNFTVTVPEVPAAQVNDFAGKAISTAEPLTIQLTSPDVIHRYSLAIADKTAPCDQADGKLSCDVAPLKLAHGTNYEASLYQKYKDVERKVIDGTVETLQPLVLSDSTVKEGQTVYVAPTTFEFTFDQELKDIQATLVKVTGETIEKVETTARAEGSKLVLGFAKLDREATYRLDISRAVANSGSSLAQPLAMTFTTSGGPKVAGVSVGANSVPLTATITVTLDQPITEDTDLAKLARVEGVTGTVKRKSATELVISIQGGECAAFKIIVDKGLKSESNGELSKEAWTFSSRTLCGSSWAIGTSVKGRAIPAYSFGGGSKVILFTAGIHGSEPSSTSTMQAWVKYLQANAGDVVPADKRIVIVPNTNPDAIAAGTRYNANNVNIGRNFPTANWSPSIETSNGVLPNGGGTSAGSEPETAALSKLFRQLKPRLALSYHAQGRLVGANKFADSVSIGDTYAKTVGYKTMYYNAEEVMGYAMTGELEDWMGEEMNIPAILIELPSPSGNYLDSQMTAIRKMLVL